MKTLSTPVNTEVAAAQSGWCECYDIYLKSSITTPAGTTNILRLTNCPGGLNFFTPKISPEPAGTQGAAAVYTYWPIKRETVRAEVKYTNDKLNITASNVTREFQDMIAAISWYDTPVIIRKVPLTIASPTADDCGIIFSGAVDAAKMNEKVITLECSSDLASLQATAPRENMHTSCRFAWADDLCTAIRFKAENYKAKTCGASSTTTLVKSADLTEDGGSSGSYGTDLVNALANAAITTSSEGNGLTATAATVSFQTGISITASASTDTFQLQNIHANIRVNDGDQIVFNGTTMPTGLSASTVYYAINTTSTTFKVSTTPGGSAVNFTTNGSGLTMSTTRNPAYLITIANHQLSNDDVIQFAATTLPVGLTAATDYYVSVISSNTIQVRASVGGPVILLATTGTAVTASTINFYTGYAVKSSVAGYWKMGNSADWGTESNGYFTIPDAQSGLANATLKPYIQFDFGSAKTPRVWRIMSAAGLRLEELVRKVVFFSSTDNATWKHETYFELPPVGGVLYDVLIPKAQTARYWRICIRSRWAQPIFYALLSKVYAYENSRQWWANGRITFATDTATAALRGVSRKVLESYSGEVKCLALPVAPASGDTFVIERGCPRTFNACCERLNWENYGGFTDLPYQTVIR